MQGLFALGVVCDSPRCRRSWLCRIGRCGINPATSHTLLRLTTEHVTSVCLQSALALDPWSVRWMLLVIAVRVVMWGVMVPLLLLQARLGKICHSLAMVKGRL